LDGSFSDIFGIDLAGSWPAERAPATAVSRYPLPEYPSTDIRARIFADEYPHTDIRGRIYPCKARENLAKSGNYANIISWLRGVAGRGKLCLNARQSCAKNAPNMMKIEGFPSTTPSGVSAY
jgi:hypothetical protein